MKGAGHAPAADTARRKARGFIIGALVGIVCTTAIYSLTLTQCCPVDSTITRRRNFRGLNFRTTWRIKTPEEDLNDAGSTIVEEEEIDQMPHLDGPGVKQLPKAIIIGVKKGGTRALLEFLRLHPDVRAPGPEIHFFDRHYHKGLEWYKHQMPKSLPGQITVEKTPSYFVTQEVPSRMSNFSKSLKLLIVVRDPVIRAISDYTQTASKRVEVPPFEDLAFRAGNWNHIDTSWSAIKIGMYARHLERWLRYFSLDNILFVSGERLVSNPAKEMGRVQDFLGLKRIVQEKHFYYNATKGFPCLKKNEKRGTPRCLGRTKGREHPILPPEVISSLRSFFRPLNQKFYQMVHYDFGWS